MTIMIMFLCVVGCRPGHFIFIMIRVFANCSPIFGISRIFHNFPSKTSREEIPLPAESSRQTIHLPADRKVMQVIMCILLFI